MSTRKGPFSVGTQILLKITKNGAALVTNATVVYNLKTNHGNLFRGDAARSSGYPCRLDKSCNRTVNSRLTAP